MLVEISIVDAMRISNDGGVNAVFFAKEGGSVTLRCPCDKNTTTANFAWLCPKREYFSQFSHKLSNDRQHIDGSPSNQDSPRNGRQRITNGTLEISTVCGSDAGVYKCLAETECVDCAICQATVRLEVANLGNGQQVNLPACAKQPRPSSETLHYSDWTYGALIFSAGLVLGLALAMFIVIFRRRSRKRFGSRRSNLSSKDSFMRGTSILQRHKADSLRRATHLLQKTRTISHRWMPIREESFQDCQSMMTAFDDPEYGMYVNPLRTRNSRCSSIPSGPPPLPPRPKSKESLSGHDTSDYEEADETMLVKDVDIEDEDNLEDSDGYVKMTIPSRPNSEMPPSLGRCSEFHPNSSILKDFAMEMGTPETNVNVSYIELLHEGIK